jgi:hypothetical protein
MDLCPKSRRKNKKNGKNRKKWVSGKKWEKNEKLANGRPAVGGLTGERPAVVLRWWGRCWVVVGVGGFGFREEKDGGGVSGVLYGQRGRMGKEGKK